MQNRMRKVLETVIGAAVVAGVAVIAWPDDQPAAPTSLADTLKNLNEKVDGVEVDKQPPPIINVTFKVLATPPSGDALRAFSAYAVDLLSDAWKSKALPASYAISLIMQMQLVDNYGHALTVPAIRLELPSDELSKIDFSSGMFTGGNLLNIAKIDYIEPHLQRIVGEFCLSNKSSDLAGFCNRAKAYMVEEYR